MLLGDFSPCLQHVVHAYHIAKTEHHSKYYVEECEKIGVTTCVGKKKIQVHLQIATTSNARLGPHNKTKTHTADTRHDHYFSHDNTTTTHANTTECRTREYATRLADVDLILVCFYENNSKTLRNIEGKYVDEIRKWFPKTPYHLLGLRINQLQSDGAVGPLRETISVQDRWLKRELDVTKKQCEKVAQRMKAGGSYAGCTLVVVEDEEEVGGGAVSDDVMKKCRQVERVVDKCVKLVVRGRKKSCVRPLMLF